MTDSEASKNTFRPLVSVIIPAYNVENYLAQTIHSILQQTYQSFEIIIVNDGSTDNTLALSQKLAESDVRIKVISQTNSKQGKTRNTGVLAAKGEVIAFLDGDDIWLPNKLEIQLANLEKHKVDLVFSDGFICLNNDLSLREHTFQITEKIFDQSDLELFYRQNQVPTSTVICTKIAFENAGCFDEELEVQNCEDYLLWTRMLNKGARFFGLDENLILYRVHPASSTANRINQLRPLAFALMRLHGPQSNDRLARIRQTLKDLLTEINTFNKPMHLAYAPLNEYCSRYKGRLIRVLHKVAQQLPRRFYVWLSWRLI
jgi:glycosyltransferase involved in cell wall biosynthesis